MDNIFKFADLISALFGLAGAIVLGWPAVTAMRTKKYWQSHVQVTIQASQDPKTAHDPAVAEALGGIKDSIESGLLGANRGDIIANLIGFGLLVVSFGFLLVASIGRLRGAG